MTTDTPGGLTTSGQNPVQTPFTLDSGGGPKEGPLAGQGSLADDNPLPPHAWNKTQNKG